MILATGFPRSGTGYTARLLKFYGKRIGHEKLKEDGVCAWQLASFRDPYEPFRIFRHLESFDPSKVTLFIQVVRNPVNVLASFYHTVLNNPWVWKYMIRCLGIRRKGREIDFAVQLLVEWNRMIQKQKPDLVVRVEEGPAMFAEWFDVPVEGDRFDKRYNRRPHPPIHFKRLSKANRERLLQHAETYGYSIG